MNPEDRELEQAAQERDYNEKEHLSRQYYMQKDARNLKRKLLVIACAAGTVGIALKFLTYLDHWVYFPAFPNALDTAFLIISILILSYLAMRRTIDV